MLISFELQFSCYGLYVTVYLNVELSKVGNSWYRVS